MAEQDFTEIARLAERYNKDPKSRIFVQLADAYRKNNMVDEALEVLKQGLQYHPQYPLAHLILGKCYYDKRMFNQAKEALEKTIQLDPVNIVALRLLAQVCENLKDEACQIKAYKGIISIDPSDEMAKNRLAQLEATQRKGEIYTLTLAQEYERQGNLEEALKVYEHLSFMDPTDLALKHKINELKNKISGVVQEIKKVEEEKIAEMGLETYLRPEEISTMPKVEVPPPPEPQLGERVVDLDQPVTPPPIEPQPLLEEIKVEPVKSAEEKTTTESEEILSLEEFLVKPEEPITVEETMPAGSAPGEAEALISQPAAPIISEETIEEPPKEEIVGSQSVAPTPEQEMKIEPGEIEEIPSFQELKTSSTEEQPKTVAETGEEKTKEPVKPVEEKPIKPEPILPEAEKPKEEAKKEETPKPKEEDFKSFQDWLQSLLK
ncbi:MAG: tetratricopeptide repeat protein [candidate division WOR-3 bacterium]